MTRKKDSFILLNETQRSESVKWSELPNFTRRGGVEPDMGKHSLSRRSWG